MNRLTVATTMMVMAGGWLSTGCNFGNETLSCVRDADCTSCTDCSCTECEDCSGCTATPVVFAAGDRMPNATQVRLSRSGLDFIEDNALALVGGLAGSGADLPIDLSVNNGVLSIPLNNSLLEGMDLPVPVSICPANNCQLDITLPSLSITADPNGGDPDRLAIAVQVDISNNREVPVGIEIGGDLQGCTFNFQTDHEAPNTLNITADVMFESAASGMGEGVPPSLVVDLDSLQGLDVQLVCPSAVTGAYWLSESLDFDADNFDSGDGDQMIQDIFVEVKSTLNQAMGELMAKLFTFCTVAQSGQCPAGSTNEDGICMLPNDTCRPMAVGVETHIDASELLGNIFPGTSLIMDVLFALQGEARAVSNGLNLSFFGGFENRAAPAACVSGITLDNPPTRPTDIPLATELQNSEDAHVVVGVAERVMDWGAFQLWEGGTLCIEAGTRLSPLLSTGLFSVLIRSLKNLSFPDNNAALAIGLRPQTPPDVTIGAGTDEDPIIQVDLEALELDFYVWSAERYVRMMTFRGDLHLALDIRFDANGEIVPVIEEVSVSNASVFDSELLTETPEQLTRAVEGVLPLISSFAGGLIPTINLGELLGDTLPIGLDLGENTLRQVTQGNDRFLGVYVDLAAPSAGTPFSGRVDTTLELVSVTVPAASAFEAENLGSGERPRIEIALAATGPAEVSYEYQYRLNEGTWSAWSRTPYAVIDDPVLLLQGRHSVEGRARVVGASDSADIIPARAEFLIDVLAPILEVDRVQNVVRVAAMDAVSPATQLEYRWRSASRDEWSEWSAMPASRLTLDSSEDVVLEVRDENGNVASNAESLRGLPPPSDGGGCGDCSVSGEPDASTPLMALTMLLGMVGLLRRRRD